MDEDMFDVEDNVDDRNNEQHNNTSSKKSSVRKRKEHMLDDDGPTAAREKHAKRILLSLTKPSYVLGLTPQPLRLEHRTRLRYLLQRLVKQHDWAAASGVLSVYMKATVNDSSPFRNRLKYSVLLELLKRLEKDSISSTRIKNLYDIWSKKIGSMKDWPVESRYAVHLEFMLFCLTEGNAGDAYQLALCLEQENVDLDPVSKFMMGLTFYELWYSSIPEEFKLKDSDEFDLPENSHMEGTSFRNEDGCSERQNTFQSYMPNSQNPCDSVASVRNDKPLSRDVGLNKDMEVSMEDDVNHEREKPDHNFQPEGFYMNLDEENGTEDPFSNSGFLTQETLYALGGLDSWLFPLHFADDNSFEEFMYVVQRNQPNDYYKKAVKYLQQALNSEHTASAALLPLTQLLLIGGQVDDALNTVEQSCNSASILPARIRSALLERLDRNNSPLLVGCFEDILKKDPTCCDSLSKLIKMHQNGDYSPESLVEMIALHLDATYAENSTWKVFASCFHKLSHCEQDCMSAYPINNEEEHKQQNSFSKIPKIFTKGMSGESWRLRCRWWLSRHFSNKKLESDIQSGDLELLTYKAGCATYMYGPEFHYVVKANSHLEKQDDRDLLLFLNEQRRNSFVIYQPTKLRF